MPDPDVANQIATWAGLALGLAGSVLGVINFIHTSRISKAEKRTQVMLDGISLDRQAAVLSDRIDQLEQHWHLLANEDRLPDDIRTAARTSTLNLAQTVARNERVRKGIADLLRDAAVSKSLSHALLEELRRYLVTTRENMTGMAEDVERLQRDLDRVSELVRQLKADKVIVETRSGPRGAP
jgi:hypothetical protein